jgi:hypothetical protein
LQTRQHIVVPTDKGVATKWHDKWVVTLLTAIHADHIVEAEKVDHTTGQRKKRSLCVVECSQNMDLVIERGVQMSFAESTTKNMKS